MAAATTAAIAYGATVKPIEGARTLRGFPCDRRAAAGSRACVPLVYTESDPLMSDLSLQNPAGFGRARYASSRSRTSSAVRIT